MEKPDRYRLNQVMMFTPPVIGEIDIMDLWTSCFEEDWHPYDGIPTKNPKLESNR